MNWEMVSAIAGVVAVFGSWIVWSLRQLRRNELVHLSEQIHLLADDVRDLKRDLKSHIQWHLGHND